MAAGLTAQPPLVGRQRELKFLEECLDEALAGKGSLIFISGEAGIGKSRLAEELGKLAEKKGCRVLIGRCLPGAPTPYLPFQDALEQFFGIRSSTETSRHQKLVEAVKRAAPELVEATPIIGSILKATAAFYKEYREVDLNPQSESERALHATLEFLQKASAKQAIMMTLDDFQWADSASISLLHFLARNSQGLRVFLVATYRPEELSSEETTSDFLRNLRIMRREQICREIALDKLTLVETQSAVQGLLNAQVDEEVLNMIAAESGGNPLFAVEIVRLLIQTKLIVFQNGVWRGTVGIRIDIPSTVREVILRRIDRLSPGERRLLECASVMGEWFDPGILEGALSLKRLDILEVLDSIERNLQLIKSAEGSYRFSHEKVQRVIYEEISHLRRKELHRTVGRILEARLPDEGLYGQLSTHFHNALDKEKSMKYSLLAAKISRSSASSTEALVFFQRVMEVAEDDPSYLDHKLQALEGLGDAYAAKGLFDSALATYQKFLDLSHEPRDKVRVLRKSAELWAPFSKGNLSKAWDLLDKAEAYGDVDKLETGRVKTIRGGLVLTVDAERLFSEAERIFKESNSLEDLANIYAEFAHLYIGEKGRSREALESSSKSLELYSRLQNPGGQARALITQAVVQYMVGLTEDAFTNLVAGREIARKLGHIWIFWGHHCFGLVYHSLDDFESAVREAIKAREFADKIESEYLAAFVDIFVAHYEVRLGRIDEGEKRCRSALDMLEKLWSKTSVNERAPLLPFAYWTLGEVQAARNNWEASNQKFRQSIDQFQEYYYRTFYEAMTRTRFGQTLARQGRKAEATGQLTKAVELYCALGNRVLAERAKKLASEAA